MSKLMNGAIRAANVVYRMAGTAALQGERPHLPADVLDDVALKVWLEDTDVFGSRKEIQEHLAGSLDRYRYTAAIMPRLKRSGKVLELGASPYFFTRILVKRGLDLTCANWFGDSEAARAGVDKVSSPRLGEQLTIPYDHFNAETERFPYAADSFDAALCCGILELLPANPTHLLAELHRVLKPQGHLVLTTPNASRADVVQRVADGWPTHSKISGRGVYGRANREYTVGEVTDLLTELGYVVEFVATLDAAPRPRRSFAPGVNPANREDTIFVRARAVGRPRWRYPSWLYSTESSRWTLVQPDLVMGHNDEVQSQGFEPLDTIAGVEGRWLGATEGHALVESAGGPQTVVVQGVAPPEGACRRVELEVCAGDQRVAWSIEAGSGDFSVHAELDLGAGPVDVQLRSDRTWRPVDVGLGPDYRLLSLFIHRVALVDQAVGPRDFPPS